MIQNVTAQDFAAQKLSAFQNKQEQDGKFDKEAYGRKQPSLEKAKVYFTKDISANGLLKVYEKVNQNIGGKVAVKWHSGEPNGPYILPVPMVKALIEAVPNSTLVETNVYYESPRQTTKGHLETLKINGWTFCPVDIMDADGAVMIPIKGGRHFKEMSVGKHLLNYDSMIVLTHFKGHTMGGYGV